MKIKYSLKNFIISYILLLILIPTSLYLGSSSTRVGDLRSKASQNINRIYFWPTNADLSLGQNYTIEIRLNSEAKPENLELVLSFNPNVVRIESDGPIFGNAYGSYHAKYYDNVKGIIGLSGQGKGNGEVFMSFRIQTLKTGDPEFKVNYLNSQTEKIDVDLPKYTVQ